MLVKLLMKEAKKRGRAMPLEQARRRADAIIFDIN
jgi:hypothetical protein